MVDPDAKAAYTIIVRAVLNGAVFLGFGIPDLRKRNAGVLNGTFEQIRKPVIYGGQPCPDHPKRRTRVTQGHHGGQQQRTDERNEA